MRCHKLCFLFIILFHLQSGMAAYQQFEFESQIEEQRFVQLTHNYRCVTCQNQSIAESSAPVALGIKEQIYKRIQQGQSDEEIAKFLIDRYGDSISYSPPLKKETWLLWLGPFLIMVGFMGFVMWYVFMTNREET